MIKFFKKIRYNLKETGKTGKYLKYAIGEIILLVCGILIALQVNNWNELRKDRIKEQIVLKQLQEDYQANLMQLEEKMATRKKILISAIQLLKAFDQPVGLVQNLLENMGNSRLEYLLVSFPLNRDATRKSGGTRQIRAASLASG